MDCSEGPNPAAVGQALGELLMNTRANCTVGLVWNKELRGAPVGILIGISVIVAVCAAVVKLRVVVLPVVVLTMAVLPVVVVLTVMWLCMVLLTVVVISVVVMLTTVVLTGVVAAMITFSEDVRCAPVVGLLRGLVDNALSMMPSVRVGVMRMELVGLVGFVMLGPLAAVLLTVMVGIFVLVRGTFVMESTMVAILAVVW